MNISQSAWDDEDRTPVKSELAVIDGKLAMYINSNDYGGTSGSRWVIKGSRLRFTRTGPNANSQGYVYGFCHQVNPKEDTITVEILGDKESDQLPTGRMEVIPVEEIGRCDPERERWPTGDSWQERSDQELLTQESGEVLSGLPFVNAWKCLLGLDDAANSNLPASTPQAGYVRYGFTYAFHYLEFAFGYRQAILETLAMGGDTDTNACIVGGLVGAYNGLNGIPKQALEKVVACKTEDGQPRPEAYTIKDVQRNLRIVCGFCIPK